MRIIIKKIFSFSNTRALPLFKDKKETAPGRIAENRFRIPHINGKLAVSRVLYLGW